MAELRDRFSMADEIGTPDLWTEARRRAAAPEARPSLDTRWSPGWRRLGTGTVAFAVFAAAVAFAWDLSHPDVIPMPPRPEVDPVDLSAELPIGWSELPAPPEVRSGAATAWTGSELLVWGGYEYVGGNEDPDAGGFAFDARTRMWSELAPSPLEGRSEPAFAWTGRELLVWGGWDGGFRNPPYFDDGAAFDPVAGAWRILPPAPIDARSAFSVWTGEEMIVWGSRERAQRRLDGAAYDPSTNTWRAISDGPIDITDGSAVWTGEEMIVLGAALDSNNHADTQTAIGVAYDPDADVWRELPASDLSPQAMTAEWLNGELIAWDYDHASAAYDPVADAWQPLPDVPLEFFECRPVTVVTGQTAFGEFCGQTVAFAQEERAWHRVPIGAPAPDTSDGCCPVFEPMAAGGVVLVTSHWYGRALEAMDRRMLVYNPPVVVRTEPTGEVFEPEPFIPTGAERDGDFLRLPIVFPDGSEVTLVYPIALDLASLGIQPEVSYLWKDDPPPRFPILFLHDPQASIAEYVEGLEPVATLASDPRVEVWEMSEDWQDLRRLFQGHWLRYHLGSWTALVALERSSEAEEVGSNLAFRETADGFPVVETTGPIALSEESGEGEGPMLGFGSTLDPSVLLWVERCAGGSGMDEVLDSGAYGSACLANGRLSADIYGTPTTVEAIVQGLRADGFQPA